MREAIFYHALNLLKHGDHRALRKLRGGGASWEECWRAQAARLPGLAARRAIHPEREWSVLSRSGIKLALAGDPGFPPLLREIPYPPFGIYIKGRLEAVLADPAVAIVGTRKATGAGKELARTFAARLARARAMVVSGLAFGIDAAAHAGALAAGGRTVAVLANGLDEVHPRSHAALAAHIIEGGGALVSEYPSGTPALPRHFLERNRLVSGLARAVVAIEAPERSGVIATARYAMEQNRDLFVVPGPAGHPNFGGSHRLIRAGATLVANPEELLADMGFEAGAAGTEYEADTPEEARVIAALRGAARALGIDEIIEAATLTSSAANRSLTMLVLKSVIREKNGRYEILDH